METLKQYAERTAKFAKVSKAIQENTLTSADLLTAAFQRSASKAKRHETTLKSPVKIRTFDPEVCDNGIKENIPTFRNVNPLPLELLSTKDRDRYFAKANSQETADVETEGKGPTLYMSIIQSVQKGSRVVEPSQFTLPVDPEDFPVQCNDGDDNNNGMLVDSPQYGEPVWNDSIEDMKVRAEQCLLHLLNHGSFEELLRLRGIGQTRAMKIMTVRNAGHNFASLQDLDGIDMNQSAIKRFRRDNLGQLLG